MPDFLRPVLRIVSSAFALSLFCIPVYPDMINIKNGGEITGIIEQETDDIVVLRLKYGKTTIQKDTIESMSRDSEENNNALQEKWDSQKQTNTLPIRPIVVPREEQKAKPSDTTKTTPIPRASQSMSSAQKRREVIDTTVVCDDKKHSYTACIPPEADEGKACPVLFCFDPGGDGGLAARKFEFAARKYGWIVVGSHNARNGPWEPIEEAQAAMIKDVKDRYKTDERAYYAAGFSGGARMSYTMAYKYHSNFNGVIACGAGFGKGTPSNRIAVYHCIGQTDSNLDEVKKAYEKLKNKRASTKLQIFPGGHAWPPDTVLKQAVDWLASQ